MFEVVQPKHRLRWEYLREVVPVLSVLDNTSVFVLKAAVDDFYDLTPKEREQVEEFALKLLSPCPSSGQHIWEEIM